MEFFIIIAFLAVCCVILAYRNDKLQESVCKQDDIIADKISQIDRLSAEIPLLYARIKEMQIKEHQRIINSPNSPFNNGLQYEK